nr:AraC family transcriptional regulator [Paracoccus mutanolyticus]
MLERFTMVAFAAAIEPLRLANQIAGRRLYEWRLLGESGQAVACSNGTAVVVDAGLIEVQRNDTILVCGGIDVPRAATRPILGWLRREARRGARIGGICTGAWVLAEAGLLDGRRATIHWENQDGFAEKFPDVTLIRTVFVEDGSRLTAAGGTTAIDLMLRQIARDHGAELASRVEDRSSFTVIGSE